MLFGNGRGALRVLRADRKEIPLLPPVIQLDAAQALKCFHESSKLGKQEAFVQFTARSKFGLAAMTVHPPIGSLVATRMEVAERFGKFLDNITLSDAQQKDGATKRESVCSALNTKYYSSSSGTANSFYVGSWGKATRTRPPRDVDVLFSLPWDVYYRFEPVSGNKQSQLLQEVRTALQASFPRTSIRGDGPVVIVPFQSYAVELLPALKLSMGQYWIPITSGSGSYKTFDPDAEFSNVKHSNTVTNNNTRDLIRMMKCWQSYCSVPLRSFHLELLSVDFLKLWTYAGKSKVYYDWMTRDFFSYLIGQANSYLFAPGTYEMMWLGDDWKSRAQTAYDRAVKAVQYEADKLPYLAGEEWQKIFGTDIPVG
jgi:hypothetical protein